MAKWSCGLQACACRVWHQCCCKWAIMTLEGLCVGAYYSTFHLVHDFPHPLQCQEWVFLGENIFAQQEVGVRALMLQHLLPSRTPKLASIVRVFYLVRNCQAAWQMCKLFPENQGYVTDRTAWLFLPLSSNLFSGSFWPTLFITEMLGRGLCLAVSLCRAAFFSAQLSEGFNCPSWYFEVQASVVSGPCLEK